MNDINDPSDISDVGSKAGSKADLNADSSTDSHTGSHTDSSANTPDTSLVSGAEGGTGADQPHIGFLDRTLRNLRRVWQGIAASEYGVDAARMRPDLPDADIELLREQMQACLDARGGAVSARARAAALGHAYLALEASGRRRFLKVLAQDFDVDSAAVDAGIAAVQGADTPEDRHRAERMLRGSLLANRVKLLRQFNALPDGIKFLIDLREILLSISRGDLALESLEYDLKILLVTWFDVDFLDLQRITWETASGALLEKLIAYEAVHTIVSWDDLKKRLASDRRFYAYFHPQMADEPLIFVEVALVNGMSGSIQALLDDSLPAVEPDDADTAIFYSISNTQKGLAGISFGNFLIKRVVDQLSVDPGGLNTFATLSPLPGFGGWLDRKDEAAGDVLLLDDEEQSLRVHLDRLGESTVESGEGALLKRFMGIPGWFEEADLAAALKGPLMRLAAEYLLQEQAASGNRALDPVAHFHLTNGARVERLNWLGDISPKGIGQSAGIMANYLYKLGDIEENHETYTGNGEVIASSGVRGLLRR